MEDLKEENKGTGLTLKDLLLQKGVKPDLEVLQKRIEELEKEIEILKSKNKDNQETSLLIDKLFNKAVKALKQENPVDAMGFLQAVLVFEPENIKAMNNLAVVYFELGHEKRAVATLNKILEKEPGNKTALKNMAVVLDK
ncbi:tetratricopeptide repeat-containing [Desulfonema limicola]|uniref:Tetratricopeptide repeat-containing n=1 Tax=Desulfonema limicola TaxID=45656 RepID=A0A975B361_9BACT|nr:tetratricopeptide repeat protein [Desulfonema limicola]QTA77935.1 tetratricopeptide repeat-containing [Desulfonema limicola]